MTGPRDAGGEFAWIARLVGILDEAGDGGAAGARGATAAIGDDTAALEGSSGELWSWTIDTLVEGVHFRFDWLDPEAVGRRALAASLSDLAAAAAAPAGALVSVAGPAGTLGERLEAIYGGLAGLARAAGCPIVGGDLARAEGPLHLTVTALGRCPDGPPPGRGGARAGDEVWLTGALGGPAAAIALLQAEGAGPAVRAHPAYDRLARPEPRCREARWLRSRVPLRAAIDVSDGLSGDLGHVAERSGVGIEIDAARVPVHGGARDAGRRLGVDPMEWALHGGDELELVLVATAGALAPLAADFGRAFGAPLTRIGAIVDGAGVALARDGSAEALAPRSWDHFAPRG